MPERLFVGENKTEICLFITIVTINFKNLLKTMFYIK